MYVIGDVMMMEVMVSLLPSDSPSASPSHSSFVPSLYFVMMQLCCSARGCMRTVVLSQDLCEPILKVIYRFLLLIGFLLTLGFDTFRN